MEHKFTQFQVCRIGLILLLLISTSNIIQLINFSNAQKLPYFRNVGLQCDDM